ncbi:MAG: DUF934 domain-containing protein [Alphaproteobacteria bacterium]|jgi:uncharacterized protein (DUF934 family)
MPIVSDSGFHLDDISSIQFVSPEAIEAGGGDRPTAVEVPNDYDPRGLAPYLGTISVIAIPFPHFADGRGFSLARKLRTLGFTGRLRAKGHIISDQYAMARACGFDEVEIDDDLAKRQPEAHWLPVIQNNTAGHPGQALRLRA